MSTFSPTPLRRSVRNLRKEDTTRRFRQSIKPLARVIVIHHPVLAVAHRARSPPARPSPVARPRPRPSAKMLQRHTTERSSHRSSSSSTSHRSRSSARHRRHTPPPRASPRRSPRARADKPLARAVRLFLFALELVLARAPPLARPIERVRGVRRAPTTTAGVLERSSVDAPRRVPSRGVERPRSSDVDARERVRASDRGGHRVCTYTGFERVSIRQGGACMYRLSCMGTDRVKVVHSCTTRVKLTKR